MNPHWPVTTISQIAEIFDGPHATPKTVDSGPVFLGINSLNRGRLDLSDTRHVTPEDFVLWTRRVKPTVGDIVFSYETRIGEAAIIPNGLECCLGRRMGLIRPDRTKVEPRFLLYQYLSPTYQDFLSSRTIHGSTVDRLLLTEFPSFEIQIPPLEEQHAIASLLGALDDKVELHHRMNETFEAMARAIFKDWFVDFGPTRAKAEGRSPYLAPDLWSLFPDALNNDGKPVGWRGANLSALTSKIGSGATPRGGKAVYISEGIHFIRSQNVYDHRFVWDGLVKICDEDAERLCGVTVETDDILLNITGDSILRTCIVDRGVLPARVNQHVAIIRAREAIPSRFLHLYLVQPSSKTLLLGNDAGGSRAAVTKGHLEAFPVILPTLPVLNAFREITTPWYDHISHNEAENRTLAQLRDLLLPKLMSGEIRLHEAEKLVGEGV